MFENITDFAAEREQISETNLQNEDDEQGGFVAVLHELDEQCYSKEMPFDAKVKVFYFIRHEILRWASIYGPKRKISHRDIVAATGIDKRNLFRAIKFLEDNNLILVHRHKSGKVHLENEYELHPKRFGREYFYKQKTPIFSVINGGKSENSGCRLTDAAGTVSQTVGVPSDRRVENAGMPLQSSRGGRVKNSSKELLKNSLRETDKKGKKKRGITWTSIKDALLEQFPNDEKYLDRAYKQIEREGYKGREIYCPKAYISVSWPEIRKDFVIENKSQESPKQDDEIYTEEQIKASNEAREKAMASFFKRNAHA